jgi:hypothetical protein
MSTATEVLEVVTAEGEFAHGGDPELTANTWLNAGFGPEEVEAWLDARCFDAEAAQSLYSAGITPEEACMECPDDDFHETIGYKVANGDMSVVEAVALIRQKGLAPVAQKYTEARQKLMDWAADRGATVVPNKYSTFLGFLGMEVTIFRGDGEDDLARMSLVYPSKTMTAEEASYTFGEWHALATFLAKEIRTD